MKNIDNYTELSQIEFKYKDYFVSCGISPNGALGCVEIENKEELEEIINCFNKLLKLGEDK